jgi:hypothetical protein
MARFFLAGDRAVARTHLGAPRTVRVRPAQMTTEPARDRRCRHRSLA